MAYLIRVRPWTNGVEDNQLYGFWYKLLDSSNYCLFFNLYLIFIKISHLQEVL